MPLCDLMQNVLMQVGRFNGTGGKLDCVCAMSGELMDVGVEGPSTQ